MYISLNITANTVKTIFNNKFSFELQFQTNEPAIMERISLIIQAE